MAPDPFTDLTRRRLLAMGSGASTLPLVGCLGDAADEGVDNGAGEGDAGSQTGLTIPEDLDMDLWEFAAAAEYWAWFPVDEALWSRSTQPYDFRSESGRWLAMPTDDGGIRMRVENDEPPGNAGFYLELGSITEIERITIDSEVLDSDSGDQQLLFAIYCDVTGDGEYFEWQAEGDREAFVGFDEDVEALGTFPAGGSFTIDDTTEVDLIPPFEEEIVTFGKLKAGAVDGVALGTEAALQISVIGSGADHVEEAIIHDVSTEAVQRPEVAATDWGMFQSDRNNTGRNVGSFGPSSEVDVSWEFDTDGAVRSSPTVVDGTVYVGSDDGTFYAIEAATGSEQWTFDTGQPIRSAPAVLWDFVYFGSDDGRVYALSRADGAERWRYDTGGAVRSSPTVLTSWSSGPTDEVIAIGSNAGALYIFDVLTGERHRMHETPGKVTATPLIYTLTQTDDYGNPIDAQWFIWGTTEGELYRWKVRFERYDRPPLPLELGDSITAAASATNQAPQYVGTEDGTLHGYIGSKDAWTFPMGGPIRSSPAIGPLGNVFLGSLDGTLHGIDSTTGDAMWSFDTGAGVASSPALADGMLYFGSNDRYVYAIETEDGDRSWRYATDGPVRSSPAVVEGVVYVGSDDGSVYALAESA